MVGALVFDGEAFRGKPFRLPLSTNLGAWTTDAGENPLRLDQI